MQDLDPQDPRTLGDGRYTLLGILGEGSMGRTYLAECESGRVAIKALFPSRLATAKDLELFVREAEVLQKLSHPRIPAYIDAFDDGEGEAVRYYLVQEYVEGTTLRERINEGDRYDEAGAARLMRHILAILTYMHECDPPVVHRDIKPENVIIRAEDGDPALVDFGAVREVVRLTMGGGSTIIGTYGYMPPEQLMGRALPASDIYSLGITILELLTHQTPADLNGQDALRLISETHVSERFRRVLRRMVAPNLADRYATATHVVADLDAAEGGGALVHARSIEDSITKREADEALALKKASTPELVQQLAYLVLIACLVVGTVGGVTVLYNLIAMGFQGAFVAAGALSLFGLLITLLLLRLRYTHDSWEPPTAQWTKTRGVVSHHTQRTVVGADGLEHEIGGFLVHYEFRTTRGEVEGTLVVGDTAPYSHGREFDVYYQPSNPDYHEIQDFVRDPDDVMVRLFDPAVHHTPE